MLGLKWSKGRVGMVSEVTREVWNCELPRTKAAACPNPLALSTCSSCALSQQESALRASACPSLTCPRVRPLSEPQGTPCSKERAGNTPRLTLAAGQGQVSILCSFSETSVLTNQNLELESWPLKKISYFIHGEPEAPCVSQEKAEAAVTRRPQATPNWNEIELYFSLSLQI